MPPDGTGRLEAVVRGDVQGVGFRWFVRRAAGDLALTGWVANEPDGSVRVVAEGPTVALDQLMARIRTGPPGASVQDVRVERGTPMGRFDGFAIRSGSHPGD